MTLKSNIFYTFLLIEIRAFIDILSTNEHLILVQLKIPKYWSQFLLNVESHSVKRLASIPRALKNRAIAHLSPIAVENKCVYIRSPCLSSTNAYTQKSCINHIKMHIQMHVSCISACCYCPILTTVGTWYCFLFNLLFRFVKRLRFTVIRSRSFGDFVWYVLLWDFWCFYGGVVFRLRVNTLEKLLL